MPSNKMIETNPDIEAIYVCTQLAKSVSTGRSLESHPELKALADAAFNALSDLYRATLLKDQAWL